MTKAKRLTILAVCLVASVTLVSAVGLGDSWGSQVNDGGAAEEIKEVEGSANETDIESKPADDFGIIDAIAGATMVFEVATVIPDLLTSLGVPAPIVAFVTAPIVLILIYGMISVIRGFRV